MMWLPIIILLVILYYAANNNSSSGFSFNDKKPETLLKERYVKGEIDETTYLRMKETISK